MSNSAKSIVSLDVVSMFINVIAIVHQAEYSNHVFGTNEQTPLMCMGGKVISW